MVILDSATGSLGSEQYLDSDIVLCLRAASGDTCLDRNGMRAAQT